MFLIIHKKKKKHFAKIRTILREKTIKIVQQKKTKVFQAEEDKKVLGDCAVLVKKPDSRGDEAGNNGSKLSTKDRM